MTITICHRSCHLCFRLGAARSWELIYFGDSGSGCISGHSESPYSTFLILLSEVRWKIQPDRIRTMDRTMTMASRVRPAKGQNRRSGKIPLGKWERTEVILSSLLSWTRTVPRALFIYIFTCVYIFVCICMYFNFSRMCTGYCDHIDPCPHFISFSYILSTFLLLTSPPTFLSVLFF